MSEADKNAANPAAQSAGLTLDQVNAAIKAAVQPFADTIKSLTDNQKVLADTMAADAKAKAEASGAAKKDGGDKADAAAPLTADAVAKIVAEGIAADRKAQSEQAEKKTQRDALVAKVAKEKLGGDADLAASLVGDDEASLNAAADKLAATVKKYKPDFGGASKDGGETPNGKQTTATVPAGNLSKGAAAFAAGIKLPTATA